MMATSRSYWFAALFAFAALAELSAIIGAPGNRALPGRIWIAPIMGLAFGGLGLWLLSRPSATMPPAPRLRASRMLGTVVVLAVAFGVAGAFGAAGGFGVAGEAGPTDFAASGPSLVTTRIPMNGPSTSHHTLLGNCGSLSFHMGVSITGSIVAGSIDSSR